MSKDIWFIGTGASCARYSKYVKMLGERRTMVLHRAYPHCVKHFGFHPTYWTWLDPDAAMDGLNYLMKLKKVPKTKILLLHPQLESKTRHEFIRTTGTSVLSRNDPDWNNYIKLLKKVEAKGTRVKRVKAMPLKQLIGEKGKYQELFNNTDDIKNRFNGEQIVVGSGYEKGKKAPLLESKLTSTMLPLAIELGYKRIFIVGFDYQGGRFYRPKHLIKQNPNYHEDLLLKWKKWGQQSGFEIFSVVEDSFTKTNKYIDYIPIKKAIKMSEENK
jgi:hypothetical protein